MKWLFFLISISLSAVANDHWDRVLEGKQQSYNQPYQEQLRDNQEVLLRIQRQHQEELLRMQRDQQQQLRDIQYQQQQLRDNQEEFLRFQREQQ